MDGDSSQVIRQANVAGEFGLTILKRVDQQMFAEGEFAFAVQRMATRLASHSTRCVGWFMVETKRGCMFSSSHTSL